MLSGTDILEMAAAGRDVMWSVAYAAKVCRAHGLSLDDYLVERLSDASTRVPAADLLGWMGY